MKSGTYRVSFDIELSQCGSKDEAVEGIKEMIVEMLDDETFPEVDLELLEELDLEYNTEENELQELNF